MDKRHFMGLDKLHGCLSTIFPSNPDGGSDDSQPDSEGHTPATGRTDGGKKVAATYFEGKNTLDPSQRRRLSVKFTKHALEVLRETLNLFLRRVGRDLAELDTDPMSQRAIPTEVVARVLGSLESDDNNFDEVDDATKPHAQRELEQIVARAQDLLQEQKRRESQQKKKTGGSKKRKGSEVDPTDANNNSKKVAAKMTRLRKQRKKKITVTAEMEAEQERLLNASKKALESSWQQNQQH